MAKFMVLYRAPVSAQEQMSGSTPEQAQEGMEAWNAWGAKAGDALVDFGSPVSQVGVVGGESSSSGGSHIGGFSVLEADSVDSIRPLLDDHPHFMVPGASIEILEYLPTPGM